ncbi:hypothetical protein EJ04DRAFT_568854 [Polyplosphaeria fusca]|uniref:Uncharacterized protein n=1 Tax=Polyplosphaeria fusca TaxID=682080 RepID=A0A9P4UXR9_9PLEO|nr:hypothetical protein EJ04DRAFT_568854 [Polyplosphaeria fusca]
MAPLIPTFHVSELEAKVNELPHGKTRSPPVHLAACPLKELVQYRCNVQAVGGGAPSTNGKGENEVVCEPVVRFYRTCQGMTIETSAWEEWNARQAKGASKA